MFHKAAGEEDGDPQELPHSDLPDSLRTAEGPSDEVSARELQPSAPQNGENLHPDAGVDMEGPLGESRVADLISPDQR